MEEVIIPPQEGPLKDIMVKPSQILQHKVIFMDLHIIAEDLVEDNSKNQPLKTLKH